jgi:hypothetical protein
MQVSTKSATLETTPTPTQSIIQGYHQLSGNSGTSSSAMGEFVDGIAMDHHPSPANSGDLLSIGKSVEEQKHPSVPMVSSGQAGIAAPLAAPASNDSLFTVAELESNNQRVVGVEVEDDSGVVVVEKLLDQVPGQELIFHLRIPAVEDNRSVFAVVSAVVHIITVSCAKYA